MHGICGIVRVTPNWAFSTLLVSWRTQRPDRRARWQLTNNLSHMTNNAGPVGGRLGLRGLVVGALAGLGKGPGFTLAFLATVGITAFLAWHGKITGSDYADAVAWIAGAYFAGGAGKAWADYHNGSKGQSGGSLPGLP